MALTHKSFFFSPFLFKHLKRLFGVWMRWPGWDLSMPSDKFGLGENSAILVMFNNICHQLIPPVTPLPHPQPPPEMPICTGGCHLHDPLTQLYFASPLGKKAGRMYRVARNPLRHAGRSRYTATDTHTYTEIQVCVCVCVCVCGGGGKPRQGPGYKGSPTRRTPHLQEAKLPHLACWSYRPRGDNSKNKN